MRIKMIWLQEKIKTLLEQVRNMVACFSLSLEKSHLVIPFKVYHKLFSNSDYIMMPI